MQTDNFVPKKKKNIIKCLNQTKATIPYGTRNKINE